MSRSIAIFLCWVLGACGDDGGGGAADAGKLDGQAADAAARSDAGGTVDGSAVDGGAGLGCPATREAAARQACDSDAGPCDYDGLRCECTNCPSSSPVCRGDDPLLWSCEAPNPDPECPPARPALGASCTNEGKTCAYGCEAGQSRMCTGGQWAAYSAPGGCPASSRRVKRDIRYLSDRELDAIAQRVLGFKLATYEYSDPALRGRRRLGFILEDQDAQFAADPERSQVDLYGYLSMLAAATQRQSAELRRLREEIRGLRSDRQCLPKAAP